MKLVIAGNNKDKIKEIKEITRGVFDEVFTLSELGVFEEIEETGATFMENALIKARTASKLTGFAALSDDSGLSVDALFGAPGIYSARYAGEPVDHQKNIDKLLFALKDERDRRAGFITVVCLYFPDGRTVFAEGRCEGEILTSRRGTGGFGYDPVFYSYDLKKSFAEASPEEKNSVSHRGRALRKLVSLL